MAASWYKEKQKQKKCQCMYGLFSKTLFTTESSTRLGFLSDANSQFFYKVQAETGGKLPSFQLWTTQRHCPFDFCHLLWCPFFAFLLPAPFPPSPFLPSFLWESCIFQCSGLHMIFLFWNVYLRPDHCPYYTNTRKFVGNTLLLTYNLFIKLLCKSPGDEFRILSQMKKFR